MTLHPAFRATNELSAWARRVLDTRVYAVLATLGPDGFPHTTPLGYYFDGERILLPSGAKSRKVRNIEADPRVRVLVQAPAETLGQDGWVAADGTAHIVRGEEARRLNVMAEARYQTEEGRRQYEAAIAWMTDVTIVVTPQRWQTWDDAGYFAAILERGYTEQEVAGWHLPQDR